MRDLKLFPLGAQCDEETIPIFRVNNRSKSLHSLRIRGPQKLESVESVESGRSDDLPQKSVRYLVVARVCRVPDADPKNPARSIKRHALLQGNSPGEKNHKDSISPLRPFQDQGPPNTVIDPGLC